MKVAVLQAYALVADTNDSKVLIEESGTYNVFDTKEQAEEALKENEEVEVYKNFRIAECMIILTDR